jgi:hypothetical protein
MTSLGPVPPDERIERLALALYQHRAERLGLRSVPDIKELGVLYDALSKEAAADGGGGVGAALRVGGVESLVVREVAPQPMGEGKVQRHVTDEERALWEKLGDPDVMSRELLEAVTALPDTTEAAQEVFRRLEGLLHLLPEDLTGGFEFYRRLHEVVVRLPKSLRRAVMSLLLSKVREEPLAKRMIGTMTDADLARVLVDQGVEDAVDPVELARWLVQAGVRGEDLVELTVALRMGRVEGGTILAGLERVGINAPASGVAASMARTVSSLLARGLVGVGHEDVQAIRDGFPSSPEQRGEVILGAFSDYLRAESDPDRLTEVLGVWADRAAEALRNRDEEKVADIVGVMRRVVEGDQVIERRALVDATLHRILSSAMLADLISVADGEGKGESTIRLLRPFGGLAVDELMEDLAHERERGRRAMLLAILSGMARGHHGRVARWLKDDRWFVARNAVTILYRSSDKEVVPLLAEASRHKEPPVRREAARGLLAVAGLDAVPELMVLATDPDGSVRAALISAMGGLASPGACGALARLTHTLRDPGDQRRALDAIARHPSPEATGVLAELASSRARPKLPRRIRRYAKSQAKARRERNL